MSVYTDIHDAATDPAHVLRKQVATALFKTAGDVMNESDATEDHPQRLAWARRVIADPVSWAEATIWLVLQNATIQAAPTTSTDDAVQFVTNGLVSSLMKVTL